MLSAARQEIQGAVDLEGRQGRRSGIGTWKMETSYSRTWNINQEGLDHPRKQEAKRVSVSILLLSGAAFMNCTHFM